MNVIDVGGALYLASCATAVPEDIVQPPPDSASAADKPVPSPKESSAQTAPPERPYPAPAELPTQRGPKGIRFDFNDGCRVAVPAAEHPWRVRLSDLDTGNILFETEMKAGCINSTKRYYVRV